VKPEELLYRDSHEWAAVRDENGVKVATVGISAFAVEQLTDLVFLALPEIGRQLTAGEAMGEVESVKAVSSLYSPVTGEIIDVHRDLADRLEVLNSDPYGEGWMVKIKITDDSSLAGLMDYAAYQKQCAAEGSH
jgi:glycine cleavage system H protein